MIGRNVRTDLKNIVIRSGKELFSEACPFFTDMREIFSIIGDEVEIPACPFSFEHAKGNVVGIEDFEFATDGEKLLLELTDQYSPFVQHFDGGQEPGNTSLYSDHFFPQWRFYHNLKRCHSLEVGEAKHFGEES